MEKTKINQFVMADLFKKNRKPAKKKSSGN